MRRRSPLELYPFRERTSVLLCGARRALGTHASGHISEPAKLDVGTPLTEDVATQEDLDSLMDVAGTLQLRCASIRSGKYGRS